ncbi:MAG: nuclear transport factor 2 family protein [Myxococcota bacterium]|nr:nuclear transport factor 2 family protein [Myxococcota bacterium]
MHDVDGFLERFFAFGAAPSTATYLPLFHPEATLFDSGMERPITVPEIPEHIEAILKVVPDFQMTPERWRERGGTVFVEASNRATVGTTPAQWRSIYCVDLEGDRVIRGRRYYDRRQLFTLLNPELPSLPEAPARAEDEPLPDDPEALAQELGAGWQAGRAPAQHRPLASALGDLEMELVAWAGDAELVFLEWKARALGLSFGVADRIDRAAGKQDARAYYDTLTLATALAAAKA